MISKEKEGRGQKERVLSSEQEEILDLYLKRLDDFYSRIKETEKVQAEIETLHLKRILTK